MLFMCGFTCGYGGILTYCRFFKIVKTLVSDDSQGVKRLMKFYIPYITNCSEYF